MSINIKSLKTSKEGQVREVINTPNGLIEVYEPTAEVVGKIIQPQFQNQLGMDTGKVVFDSVDVLKILFPLLTNINFDDLTDDELQDVIENPSIHLMTTQQVIAQIVAEANKLYSQRVKTELMNTESAMAQLELIQSIPTAIVERAKIDGNVSELIDKFNDVSNELDDAIEKESVLDEEEEVKSKENEKDDSQDI
ncbi:hypothetical protein [Bacillus pumilus]|uniref:hypothetical protein n=1 Tax=Bacillus pumilus TaxID=1408 RepID=UPI0011A54626|nr:hypothetical protein [Bacillus pumilus]